MLYVYKIEVALVPPNIDRVLNIISDYNNIDIIKANAMSIVTSNISLININTISVWNISNHFSFLFNGLIVKLAYSHGILVSTTNLIPYLYNTNNLTIPITTELPVNTIVQFKYDNNECVCIQ